MNFTKTVVNSFSKTKRFDNEMINSSSFISSGRTNMITNMTSRNTTPGPGNYYIKDMKKSRGIK